MDPTGNSQTISRVLYHGTQLRIGHFHLKSNHPDFATAGSIVLPTLVFPRTPTYIQQRRRKKFLSQPNHVNIYDGQRTYFREACDPRGDICDWFEFHSKVFTQALSETIYDVQRGECVLDIDRLSCSPKIYWQQRQIINQIATQSSDPQLIEESVLQLLADVLNFGLGFYFKQDHRGPSKQTYDEICREVQVILSGNIYENLTLDDIANKIGVSTFHMCRVFKKLTGGSIHQYRLQLRLKYALDYLAEEPDISKVALDLGFASHSHFSTAFVKTYGYQPKQYKMGGNTNSTIGVP